MEERETWPGRLSFVFAAMGSAIGLGNVWRFPYYAYKYGGGAFLVPYFVALFTTGIPLMMLELAIGQKMRGSAPMAFGMIDRRYSWVGWWVLILSFAVVAYYTVIMSWCLVYTFHSLTVAWGSNADGFFRDFLGITSGPGEIGSIQIPIISALVVTWLIIYWIVSKGVKRVGRVVMLTVPLPVILLVILVLRGITLDGSADGINYYLTPDFSELGNGKVWLAAYAQIFFTLSLAQGVMIAYASYLPKRSDISNNAIIISLANCGTSFFAGFAVFSILGFLAFQQGSSVANVVNSGPGLAFIAYPTAIKLLPFAASLFGVIFFLMLISLGIDSAFSIVEGIGSGLIDAGVNRERAIKFLCMVGFLFGMIFTTGAGYYWIDIVDHFVNEFGLVTAGALEAIVIAYLFGTSRLRALINSTSEVKVGMWWEYAVKYLTPAVLIVVIAYNLHESIRGYGGYPYWAILAGGWGMLLATLVLAFYAGRWVRWR